MAGNILKGIINVEIPGVEATTKKAGAAVEALGSTVQKTAAGIDKSAERIAQSFSPIAPATNRAAQSLSSLQRQVSAFGGGVQSFNSGFIAPLLKIPPAADNASRAIARIPNASNSATLSLTNLGRVVQDAPFGFIGIANNLNPLLESFQRLKVSTGSTGGALKALGSSLGGAGGIGLAVSVASTALILFGDRLFGIKKKTEDAEDATKKYKDAVSSIFSSAGKEAAEAAGLVAVLKSETETRERKLLALKELKQIQPEIFGQLKLEANAVAGVDAAYQTYLQNLRTVIAVKIKQALLEQKITELLKLQGATLTKSEKDLLNIGKSIRENLLTPKKDNINFGLNDVLKNERKKAQEQENRINSDIEALFKDIEELSKGVKISGEGKGLDSEFDKIIKKAKELEDFFAQTIVPLHLDLDPQAPKAEQLKKALAFIKRAMEADAIFPRINIPAKIGVNLLIDRTVLTNEVTKKAPETYEEVRKKFEDKIRQLPVPTVVLNLKAGLKINADFEARLKAAADAVTALMGNAFQDISTAMAEGLGNALSGGNFGQEIIGVIGSLIQQIGKAMVAYGVVKKGLDQILKAGFSMPGATAIALGLAAVALGALIKNSFKPQGRAAGGFVDAGKPYMVGEVGRELFVPNVGGRIIPNNQIGQGSASFSVPRIQVVGEFIQRGKDMVATIQQVQGFQGRNA